jgi:hypothetical protein
VDRDLWWTSGLKKAKGIKSNILRPSSHHSNNSQKTVSSKPQDRELRMPEHLTDSTQQPAWTYANTLSPNLPSGTSFDLPLHEVPELEGDSSSRRTNSTEARFSRKHTTIAKLQLKSANINSTRTQVGGPNASQSGYH